VGAFSNSPSYHFFSTRTGCQVFKPLTGIAVNALCLKAK